MISTLNHLLTLGNSNVANFLVHLWTWMEMLGWWYWADLGNSCFPCFQFWGTVLCFPTQTSAHWHSNSLFILRLATILCMSGRPQTALFIIAVVCSTWSAVNLHTSQRDILTPYGDTTRTSVNSGNRMVARLVIVSRWGNQFDKKKRGLLILHGTPYFCIISSPLWPWCGPGRVALMLLLLQCLQQHWFVENPASSCLLLHPWMNWAIGLIKKFSGKDPWLKMSSW